MVNCVGLAHSLKISLSSLIAIYCVSQVIIGASLRAQESVFIP